MSTVADSLSHLTPEWLTRVLREGGHTEAAAIEVAAEPMQFTGAVADMARLRLAYDGSGTEGPATVIAKIRGDDDLRRGMDAAMGLYAREAAFYAQFADRVPVATPVCFHVGDGTTTPLLLEDLGGLRMGDQMQGLSLPDAERLMEVLAELHARFWGSPDLGADWIVSPAEGPFAGMIVQLVGSGVEALRERFADQAPPGVLDEVAEAAPRWGEILQRCTEGPQTLVHNDCRGDNIFFRADGEPVFVDWQIPARTRGTQDIGNLLAGSMDTADLSAHWENLLHRYHAGLLERGVRGYSWEECVEHYRQNILYPLGAGIALLGSLDIGDGRGLGEALVLRGLHHVAELDSFATV
jgi:hypothetical protein